jgi:hypothetical protein
VAKSPKLEQFVFARDDPLASEHAAVTEWIEDALTSLDENHYYQDVDLKSLPSGQRLLDAKPEQARRYVLAAVAQVGHWDRKAEEIRARAATEMERINAHHLPGWGPVWGRRRQAEAVISALVRRNLPLDKDDLLAILRWCNGLQNIYSINYYAPIGHITRALKRYASEWPIAPDLRAAIKEFAVRLRGAHDKQAKRLGTDVEQLCVDEAAQTCPDDIGSTGALPAPGPAPAGCAGVLDELKRFLGMLTGDAAPPTTVIEPDRFSLRDDSPLRHEHEMLGALFEEVIGTTGYSNPNLEVLKAGRALLALKPPEMGKALLAATERHVYALLHPSANYQEHRVWQAHYAAAATVYPLMQSHFELDCQGFWDFLLYLSKSPEYRRATLGDLVATMIARAEQEAAYSPLTEGERYVSWLFRASLISGPPLGSPSEEVTRLSRLINDGANFYLVPGEAWADSANDEVSRLKPSQRQQWAALFRHALTATAAKPSEKWLKSAGKLVEAIGEDNLRQALGRWLPLVALGQTIRKLGSYSGDVRGAGDVMNEENATCLRGLLWLVQTLPRNEDLARPITAVALSAYRKVPGVGPRAVKVGNATVYALSQMASTDAVGQLAMLKVRVKFGTAQKEIEKAFNTAAEALALPRDQIEEMGVPSYGLEEVGLRRETLGGYRADLIVTGADAALKWFDSGGKPLKSAPAKVKSEHGDDLKELQQSLKDIQAMLPAQRDRIDSMFLLEKTWPIDTWRERYLDHPLIGTIARRLLWCVDGTPALFRDGTPTDVNGNPIAHGKTAEIRLWHPVASNVEQITAWRRRLEELEITQPFKQAHRELYLLTDAERNTHTYSNRFAAHVLRQHQFNALCAARGWRNKLRLMVDDAYPPATRDLPQWGLRAEFWIEGIGQDYGTETNESGVYLRLSTDQVRFYRTEAARNLAHAGGGGYGSVAGGPGQGNLNEPLPLEHVPPLVFSEIMRDVDLFVGVASVGNDPSWQDGGPQGRFRDYWQRYSFGELSGTATTRKQVLERLVPRLKIADRCSLSDRFLVVRGDKRAYKIHLGSGNILMEPNDQYLCIVPDARSRTGQDDLYLPFEGDNTLSIIISKALMLARDTKIKDPTITRQIDAR